MPQNESKPKKKSKSALYIVIVLVIIAVVGVTGFFLTRNNDDATLVDTRDFTSYPTVNATISSSRDGKTHTLDLDLVVEYADGTQVSHDEVYEIMKEAVAALDYEALKQVDSVEHIEETVKRSIQSNIDGEVFNVFVGNIAIDFPGQVDSTAQSKTPSETQQKLKGLFKNLAD